jgi:hypothetical protein
MEITQLDIEKFQRIWQEEFKEEISEDEARLQLRKLDALYLFLHTEKGSNRNAVAWDNP